MNYYTMCVLYNVLIYYIYIGTCISTRMFIYIYIYMRMNKNELIYQNVYRLRTLLSYNMTFSSFSQLISIKKNKIIITTTSPFIIILIGFS